MEIVLIIAGVLGLVAIYFCTGVVLKFLWGWWLTIFAVPVSVWVGIGHGWWGAAVGVVGVCAAVAANNAWHDAGLYLMISERLDKLFYFKDT